MALLERVGTLLRANVNDLIDRAEDPDKMVRQVILDMENQLMQVKTQLAITIADLHLLERRRKESLAGIDEWMRKAELAVTKKQDDLARLAIARSLENKTLAGSFDEQIADQKVQVENLKAALGKLEQKLAEAHAKSDLLIAQHRRARASVKASQAQIAMGDESKMAAFDRMKHKVMQGQAVSEATAEMASDNLDDRLRKLDREDQIEKLLVELKARRTGQV